MPSSLRSGPKFRHILFRSSLVTYALSFSSHKWTVTGGILLLVFVDYLRITCPLYQSTRSICPLRSAVANSKVSQANPNAVTCCHSCCFSSWHALIPLAPRHLDHGLRDLLLGLSLFDTSAKATSRPTPLISRQ